MTATNLDLIKLQQQAKDALLKQDFVLADSLYQKVHPYQGQTDKTYLKAYSLAKFSLNQVDTAMTLLRRYVEYHDDAEAWHNIGEFHFSNQQWQEAEVAYAKATSLGSKTEHDWVRLIDVQGKLHKAYQQVLTLVSALRKHPNTTKFHGIEGNLLSIVHGIKLEQPDAAHHADLVWLLERWSKSHPAICTQFFIKLIQVLDKELVTYAGFLALFTKRSQANRLDFHAVYCAALSYQRLSMPREAVLYYELAYELQPDNFSIVENLAIELRKIREFERAVALLEKAELLQPGKATVLENLAMCCFELGDYERCIKLYRDVIPKLPKAFKTRYSLGIVLLMCGQFKEGWEHYAHRYGEFNISDYPDTAKRWRGEDGGNKHIFVFAEQGLGDTINFVRYVLLLAKQFRRVTVSIQPPLLLLCNQLIGKPANCQFIPNNTRPTEFDYYCSMLDIAAYLDSEFKAIPLPGKNFNVPEDKRIHWGKHFPDDGKPRIGIVWRGTSKHPRDVERSVPLSFFDVILKDDSVNVLSLQLGEGISEIGQYQGKIKPFDQNISDFIDSAAIIEQLDLVIAVDTSVAHLAGALNIPTWLLLSHTPDWRWLTKGDKTHWYSSVELFRQQQRCNWEPVMERIELRYKQWRSGLIPISKKDNLAEKQLNKVNNHADTA